MPLKLKQGEKSERSQDAILQAALKLFSKQGFRGTSIREIATEAGLSTGNVYHHFPDKEALFITLLDQYWQAIASPDFPFNKALADGAFPDDLEALALATEKMLRAYRPYVALIYVDVVEFEGIHLHDYYAKMAERFSNFLSAKFPGDALRERLADGFHPNTALMVASRLFLDYFSIEIMFGVSNHFGLDNATAITEMAGLLRTGMLRQ